MAAHIFTYISTIYIKLLIFQYVTVKYQWVKTVCTKGARSYQVGAVGYTTKISLFLCTLLILVALLYDGEENHPGTAEVTLLHSPVKLLKL